MRSAMKMAYDSQVYGVEDMDAHLRARDEIYIQECSGSRLTVTNQIRYFLFQTQNKRAIIW